MAPTEPGWWWVRWEGNALFVVEVDRETDGTLFVALHGDTWSPEELAPTHPGWRWVQHLPKPDDALCP